jgi:cytochrome c oxidase subunit IV
MANIQTDAIDYYAIVQRLVGDEPPIVPNLPFVEQRSPGYPLLAVPAATILKAASAWIEPETVKVAPPAGQVAGEPARPSEQALLPPQPLRFGQLFFKNFDLAPQGGLFRWNIIAAMLLTSYALFFAGLFISGRTLALLYAPPVGYSLPPLLVLTSMVFMHNLLNTPAYATLAVFGVSAFFTWAWVRGWQGGSARDQALAGLFAGLLVLTRLETVLIVAVLLAALALTRQWRFLRRFILGGLPVLALLLAYNATQFGNPLHTGILQGNMNIVRFDASYVLATLAGPQSGILFWSALTSLGIIGLFASPAPSLKALGWAALALIALIALRVPVMVGCVGQGTIEVSGIVVACPPDSAAMLQLIRADANRYVIPLAPFAVLGLRGLLGQIPHLFRRQS